ncbi:acyltransferase, partial [Stutzerimonas kunmingensis]
VTFGLNYADGGMAVLALATISIFFMIALSMWLGQFRVDWFLFIGASSMTIYLMHILAGSGVRVILSKFLGIDSITAHLIIGTLIGTGAPLLAQVVINRYKLYFLLTPPKQISASQFHMRKAVAH